jgi:hypothetical protein
MRRPAIHTSKLAEVALNISGILLGLIRIVLHSHASWTLIPHVENRWYKKRPLTIFASSDLDIYNQITSPVFANEKIDNIIPKCPETKGLRRQSSSRQPNAASPPPISETTKFAPPPRIMLTTSGPPHRANYSIFPTDASASMRNSSSTTFSLGYEGVEIPRPLFAGGHKRGLSDQTSETIEIGFQFSHAYAAFPLDQPSPRSVHVPLLFIPPSSPAYIGDGGATAPPESRDYPGSIAISPTQPRTPSQTSNPISDLLSPGWFLRKGTALGSKPGTRDKGVMKSLPPVPRRNVSGSQDSIRSSSKLASKSELGDMMADYTDRR